MVDWANLIGLGLGLRLVLFVLYTLCVNHSVEYLSVPQYKDRLYINILIQTFIKFRDSSNW